MNRSEFAEFQKFLFVRFPEIESWLGRLPQQAETLDAWYDLLRHTDLQWATEALRRLHADENLMPRGWSYLPATVQRIAAQIESDRQPCSPPAPPLAELRKQIPRWECKSAAERRRQIEAIWDRINKVEAAKAAGGES